MPRTSSLQLAHLTSFCSLPLDLLSLAPRPSPALLQMTFKRRNGGRNKKGRGHVKRVHCASSGKMVPKDKAVKRFTVR